MKIDMVILNIYAYSLDNMYNIMDLDEKTICYEEVCKLSENSQIAYMCRGAVDCDNNRIPYDIRLLLEGMRISLYTDAEEYIKKCTIEELKMFCGEVLSYEMLDIIWEREDVVLIEDCGGSGLYPWHTWYVVNLANGEEISVYTKL